MAFLGITLAILLLTLVIRAGIGISYFGCSTNTTRRVRGELFCDGVYHCFDRYDESVAACGNDKNRSLSVEDARELFRTPVELPVLAPWYGWSDLHTYLPVDFNLTGGIFKECEIPLALSRGVNISGKCLTPADLCSNWKHQSGSKRFKASHFFDPEHISICKNLTYWQSIKDQVPCNGNFPGFRKASMKAFCNFHPSLAKCPDLSDVRLCPGNRCLDDPDYFRCRDGQYCIYHELQCDGYPQCLDGSDEDVCGVCNRTSGYPHRGESPVADFSCRHRYTGRSICAVRCDGRDGLCVAFADEVGCGANSVFLNRAPSKETGAEDWLLKLFFAYPAFSIFCLSLLKFFDAAYAYFRGVSSNLFNLFNLFQFYAPIEAECCLIPCHILAPNKFHGPIKSCEGRDWQQYAELRKNHDLRAALENLTYYCTRKVRFPFYAQDVSARESVNFTVNTCRLYYRKEKHFNTGCISKTDKFFFWVLRSSNLSGLFYDHVDKSMMTVIWLKVLRLSSPFFAELMVLLARFLSGVYRYIILRMIAVTLHSWDWLKDVLLAFAMWHVASSGKSTFPTALFAVIVLSLVMNEVAIYAVHYVHPRRETIQTWHPLSRPIRNLTALLFKRCPKYFSRVNNILLILIPVVKLHVMVYNIETAHRPRAEAWACLDGEFEEEVASEDSRDRVRLAEALLAKLRERHFALKSMIAWMKMTSNILEDFVQLVVLTLLICFTRSDTSFVDGGDDTVDVIFGAWFSSNSTNWIPLFAVISLMSLILGHMGLLSANKNGFTTLVGHWLIAFPYFLVSTAGRIFLVILFYTPILGLVNTLYHSSRGQIPANSDQWSFENPWYDNSESDLSQNVTNFHETWSKLQIDKDTDFFDLPFWVGTVPAFIIVVHVTFGYVFLRRVVGTYEGKLEDIQVDKTKSFKGDQDSESENEECPEENNGPETGSLVLAQFVSHFISIE